MELLKVFVGDGGPSATSLTKNTMVKGDLLLLDATTHAVADGNSASVVIAACNDKGIYLSAPITKANIKYLNYKKSSDVTKAEASVAVTLLDSKLTAGTTYSLGIQIKEDLRMGTYNKNTEVIASHVCPASVASTAKEVVSNLAKGFAANPLTSAGSPYQLVKVERSVSGTVTALASSGATLAVTQGAREATLTHSTLTTTPAVNDVISISGKAYIIEKYTTVSSTVKIISLDTAYQGTTAAALSANTSGAVGISAATQDTWVFTFTGVAQTQKNRYDQFRMVDFSIVTPKGYDTGFFSIADKTGPTYPIGSYRQVRDLEEKAYTNSMPLINYREFPFETFPLNADSTYDNYNLLTIGFVTGWGYNMMQSNQSEFLNTVVVAAPATTNGHFDGTPASGSTFATVFDTWYGTTFTNL